MVPMNDLKTSYAQKRSYQFFTLLEVLSKRRGCGAKDPRDLIFAHLGMLDEATREGIPVQYDRTVVEVFESTVRHIIAQTGILSVLAHVEEVEQNTRRPGLPSWVPNWTTPSNSSNSAMSFNDLILKLTIITFYRQFMFLELSHGVAMSISKL